jgi:methylated-DNA-[protein]-cysteine S-methyltransferase
MKSTYYSDTFSTPVGDFSIALDDSGAVIATAFGGVSELRKRFHSDELVQDAHRTAVVRSQVKEFLAGKRNRFDVRLSPKGTAFQKQVWMELQRIPFGQTRSYAQLAAAVGRPKAARAVGRANATNPICLLVPCHRVIGTDGSLTGFAFGEKLKRRLLELERSALKTASEPSYRPRSKVPGPRGLQSPCRVSAM